MSRKDEARRVRSNTSARRGSIPSSSSTQWKSATCPDAGTGRPIFTPTFSKHYGAVCGGVQIHIIDREALRPAELGVHLLDAIRSLDPQAFAWRQSSDGGYFVDLLLGSDQPRLMFDQGASADEIVAAWSDERDRFADRRKPYLLYS